MNSSIPTPRPGACAVSRSFTSAACIALGLGVLLASCHTTTVDRVGVIENMHWHLIQVGGAPAIIDSTGENAFIIFTPQDSNASGKTSCNRFSSHYERSGNTIAFTRIISTKMACVAQEAMQQEAMFLDALQSAATWKRTGDILELFNAEGATVARFAVIQR